MFDFNDYEDYIEPTIVEEIMEEAQEKLAAALNDQTKEMLDQVKASKADLISLKKEMNQKQNELSETQKKLDSLKKELETTESLMPDRYVERFIKERVGGNFVPGDICYTIEKIRKQETCPMCKGACSCHSTAFNTDVEVKCPTCNGTGSIEKTKLTIQKREIEDVNVSLCFSKTHWHEKSWSYAYLKLKYDDRNYHADEIYATQEEAEKALKEKEKF